MSLVAETRTGLFYRFARLLDGGPERPMWPYVRGALLSTACVWTFVVVYMALTPRSYVSRWVLNIPGATNNVSVSLESIGQSSSTPNSPFGSSSLSPKVVYKEIAEGEPVRLAAAKALGIDPSVLGRPRIKLIDETALLMLELTAASPEEAHRRAAAALVAFNAELDHLRNDELEKRDAAVRDNLAAYRAQVRIARENTSKAQRETGLASTAQYAEMVTSLTGLRRRVVELGGEVAKLDDELVRFSARLGVSPRQAAAVLKLAADPAFQKAMSDAADAANAFAIDDARFGPNHPQRLAGLAKRNASRLRLQQLVDAAVPKDAGSLDADVATAVASGSAHAELYAKLVRDEAALEGKRHEFASIATERDALEADVARLAPAAARLEDLKKDQLVADAVLSSAMARLDSSKSDIYGSYPIVQVVSPPDESPAAVQPRPFYAALGGLSGTLFSCLAWMLAWLQFAHRVRHRKSA